MKYIGMPLGMWALFSASFKKELKAQLGYNETEAKLITQKAKTKYKEIISKIPEFERKDCFKMNIVNAAMIASFVLYIPKRPSVDELSLYYSKAMMTKPMKWFCKHGGKSKFSAKDIASMKATAALKAADRNPILGIWSFMSIQMVLGMKGVL